MIVDSNYGTSLKGLYDRLFSFTYTAIVFGNIFPPGFEWVVKVLLLILILFSVMLVSNYWAVFLLLFVFGVFTAYSFYSISILDPSLIELVSKSKYIIYLLIGLGLVKIVTPDFLERFIKYFSRILLIKLLLLFFLLINMNFLGAHFQDYFLNVIDLSVFQFLGFWAILDPYLLFFPVLFYYDNSKFKYLVHTLLFLIILSTTKIGFIFAYFIVMFVRYSSFRITSIIAAFIVIILFFEKISEWVNLFLIEKAFSISVKFNQLNYIMESLSLWGNGLGVPIDINGRSDYTLENVFIYWFVAFGVFGAIFFIVLYVLLPLAIARAYRGISNIEILFFMHMAIVVLSASNPFIESNVGMLPMLLITAFFLNRKKFIRP